MRSLLLCLPLALVVAACGASPAARTSTLAPSTSTPGPVAAAPSAAGPQMLPILVSSELVVGPNRFLFSLTDLENRLLASPDVVVDLEFYDSDASRDEVVFEGDSRFLWLLEGERGLYAADVDFPSDGRWGTRFNATFPDGTTKTVRADYDVRAEPITPAFGAPAPSVDTPTAAAVGGDLAGVTTDQSPDPRFYETSIADALEDGQPFVVVFATPAFCETATCGPMLETVKALVQDNPDVVFINVEPYVMELRDGSLQPVLGPEGHLQPAPWTQAWNLLTEPFVAVVDGDGAVRAKFEGAIAAAELQAVIDEL